MTSYNQLSELTEHNNQVQAKLTEKQRRKSCDDTYGCRHNVDNNNNNDNIYLYHYLQKEKESIFLHIVISNFA